MRKKKTTILFSTGEVSGDLIGTELAEAFQKYRPNLSMWGLGGDRMAAAGVDILFSSNHMGSVGISEPLVTIPSVLKSLNRIRSKVLEKRPDAAVLIGNDVFNLILSRWLRSKNVMTVCYFPPQIWLWKGIAPLISKSYNWILTSFLTEDAVYRQAGAKTVFVGHYLRDRIALVDSKRRGKARHSLALDDPGSVVGLFPGSRRHELERLMPIMLDVARKMIATDDGVRFVLPIADHCFEADILRRVEKSGLDRWITLSGDSREAIAACDLVILCSGTVTLEAALMGTPMIVVYQVSSSSWAVVNLLERTGLIASKTVGIPNLLAGRRIVPEFIQSNVRAETLADEALNMLRDADRQTQMKKDLAALCPELGEKGGAERAARVILEKAAQWVKN